MSDTRTALDLLRELEWHMCCCDIRASCLICKHDEPGHAPDCRLAELLREPTAPHVKVTEVVGMAVVEYEYTAISTSPDDPVLSMVAFVPAASVPRSDEHYGPRGRFRITVEFWPEEKK